MNFSAFELEYFQVLRRVKSEIKEIVSGTITEITLKFNGLENSNLIGF